MVANFEVLKRHGFALDPSSVSTLVNETEATLP